LLYRVIACGVALPWLTAFLSCLAETDLPTRFGPSARGAGLVPEWGCTTRRTTRRSCGPFPEAFARAVPHPASRSSAWDVAPMADDRPASEGRPRGHAGARRRDRRTTSRPAAGRPQRIRCVVARPWRGCGPVLS